MSGLVHRDRDDLQHGQRQDAENVAALHRRKPVTARAELADPDDDPGEREDHQQGSTHARERESPPESIHDVNDPLGVVPPRDIPHDQLAEQHRQPSQRIAHRSPSRELLVHGRPLLAEETVRAEHGRHASEPVERE
jgi:hypothetical protein